MKRIWKLFRALNKTSPLPDGSSGKQHGPSIWIILGVFLALGLGFLSFVASDFVTALGGAKILVLIIGFVAFLLIFCLGIASLINSMYMSSDIEMLITLPFSATQIVVLKALTYFQYAFGGCAAMLLCAAIGYALGASVSFTDWVAIVLACILVPVSGVCLSAVIVVLLMSFLKIFRNRETLRVIGAFVLFVLFCGYLFFSSGTEIDAEAVLAQLSTILKVVKYSVPVVGFLADFMENGNVLYPLLAILCAAVAVGLFMLATTKLYLTGALNMQDAGHGKVLTEADLAKACRKKTVLKALITKEYFCVRRNPAYLMGNFIMGALWPAAAVLLFKQMLPMFSEAIEHVQNAEGGFESFAMYTCFLSLTGLILVYLPIMMQSIAYTSLSREGKSFPIMKQLPVPYEVQLEAKRRTAEMVSFASISGYSCLILIAGCILLKIPAYCAVIPLVLITLDAEFCVNMDMYFGIVDADVMWDDEKEVQQKSFTRILPVLGLWIVFFALGLILLIGLLPCTIGLTVLAVIGAGLLAASLILKKQISIKGEKKIRSLHF